MGDKIMHHMKRNKLFSNKQFGFLEDLLCYSCCVLDKWTKIIDDAGIIRLYIYCDFKKALIRFPTEDC